MVFTCSGCGTRYRIDDERLTGKSLRVVCKKCHQGHRIRSRDGKVEIQILAPGESSDSRDLSDLARPTRSTPSGEPHPGPMGSAAPPPHESDADVPPPPPKASPEPERWFALRKGARLGPMDRAGLLQHLRDGTLLPDSFVWRPTKASWQRLNTMPELADLLREFAQESRRPVDQPQAAPVAVTAPKDEVPPPLPPSARPSPDPKAGPAETGPQVKPLVDDLYLDLSRPTIDLRRAQEIQPEEPEQRPRSRFRPRPTSGTPSPKPAPMPPSPPRPAASVSLEPMHSDEYPLFPETLMASDSPSAPGDIAEISLRPQAPVAADPHMGVRDFSVMIRHLGAKSRRRNLTVAAVLGGVLLTAAGGLFAWVWLSGPKGDAQPLETVENVTPRYETPRPLSPQQPKELPRISLLAAPETLPRDSVPARPRALAQGEASTGASSAATVAPTPPEPPPVPVTIDENVQKDTARYGALLARNTPDRDSQVPMAEVPKTLERMPRSEMSPQMMNEFLEKKHRRFESCKTERKRPIEGQVLVGIAFDVDENGQVQNVQVVLKNGLLDGELAKCIRNIILEWAFPPQSARTHYQTNLML